MTQNLSNIYSDPNANKWRVDEGSSQIWGEICLERKWLWTLKRKGGHGGRRLGIFAEREEITPLGGGSKICEEDPPLWIGEPRDMRENSKFHITQIWIQMCLTMVYILWPKHKKAQHNLRSEKAQTKTLQKKYKRVHILRSKANLRSLWRS